MVLYFFQELERSIKTFYAVTGEKKVELQASCSLRSVEEEEKEEEWEEEAEEEEGIKVWMLIETHRCIVILVDTWWLLAAGWFSN